MSSSAESEEELVKVRFDSLGFELMFHSTPLVIEGRRRTDKEVLR